MKLKFLTLNTLHGGQLMDEMLGFFQSESPDIFILQEVYNETDPSLPRNLRSMETIQPIFPNYLSAFNPGIKLQYPDGLYEIGNAVFSRFPITSSSLVYFNGAYGTYPKVEESGDYTHNPKFLQAITIQLPNQELHIMNVHGVWGTHGQDNPTRLAMADTIIESIKDKSPLILAGDFNLNYATETISNIEQHIQSVFKDELTTTFNMSEKSDPGYATAAVDMIFVTDNIAVLSKSVPNVKISDHLPLIAELQIPD